jgi:hypothetical protein
VAFDGSCLVREVAFDGSCLVREVAFDGSCLVREVAFDGSCLVREVAFDGSCLVKEVAFDGSCLVREGLLYIYRLNVMFYILKKISAKSKTDDIFTIAYAYKFYQENIFYWKIHPILDQYC